jgi:hypothetical protein
VKSISVHVTDKDIREGIPRNPGCCPVARALGRTFGRPVQVSGYGVDFHGLECVVRMPAGVASFIHAYDDFRQVRPFDFTLQLPDDFPLPTEAA